METLTPVKRKDRHGLMVGIAVIFFVLVWGLGTIGAHHPKMQSPTNSQHYQPTKEITRTIIDTVSDWSGRNKDAIGAFSTVLVALFTFTLWRATVLLFKAGERQIASSTEIAEAQRVDFLRSIEAAEKSATTAERALTDLETPFLYPMIKSESIGADLLYFGQHPELTPFTANPGVTFTIKNFGRTPAIIRSVAAYLDHWSVMPNNPDTTRFADYAVQPILEPGKETDKTFEKKTTIPIDGKAVTSIRSARSSIWFHGEVVFSDIFGAVYTQTFCFAYFMGSNSFIPFTGTHNKRTRRYQGE
jgi:hypothetical protein